MIGIVARRFLEAAWERLFDFDIFIAFTRRDGEAPATAYEIVDERTLQRVVIGKAGGLAPWPVLVTLAPETKPGILPLSEPESPP